MKEHPILFTGPMVRAILDGRKTQTRRIIYPQSEPFPPGWLWRGGAALVRIGHDCGYIHTDLDSTVRIMEEACRYQIGDLLWVKETHYWDRFDKLPKDKPSDFPSDFYYRADGECCEQIPECSCGSVGKPKWRPSIFMPRWASRLTLDITDVCVERVQDISEEDAEAEGAIEWWLCSDRPHLRDSQAKTAFEPLWDSINGKKAPWQSNPWVWAVTFKKL